MEEPYTLVGDELLVAIFNSFPKAQELQLKKELIPALYSVWKKHRPKYDQLFSGYGFDTDGARVTSESIEEGLDGLERSELIRFQSVPPRCFVSSGISLRFRTHIEAKLSAEQKSLIEDLSCEVYDSLGG